MRRSRCELNFPARRHALVVDRDFRTRQRLTRTLLRAGFSVVTAVDADQADDVIASCPVPLVVIGSP